MRLWTESTAKRKSIPSEKNPAIPIIVRTTPRTLVSGCVSASKTPREEEDIPERGEKAGGSVAVEGARKGKISFHL